MFAVPHSRSATNPSQGLLLSKASGTQLTWALRSPCGHIPEIIGARDQSLKWYASLCHAALASASLHRYA